MIKAMLGAVFAMMLAAQPAARVEDLAWMSGHWETSAGEGWTEEYWSAPRGGTMLGYSRAGRGETLREFEQLRLVAGADGVPVYMASPGGGAAVGFRLTQADGTSATFANPDHDFPQLIRYRRDGNEMIATISAADGSNATSWTLTRR